MSNKTSWMVIHEEVEAEHLEELRKMEKLIIEEEESSLREQLELQKHEARVSNEELNWPELMKQLELGLQQQTPSLSSVSSSSSSSLSLSPSSSSSSSSVVQGLVEEIKSLGVLYKSHMKASKSMAKVTTMHGDENCDPNGENNSNTFEEFECSPLEKEVYSILKKANDAIHTRIEVAREVMVEKIKNANLCSQEADEGVVENLEEKKIQCDLEKSKALCKRNLQAAVAVAVQK